MKPFRSQLFCVALAAIIFPCACAGPRDAAFSPSTFQARGVIVPPELVNPIEGVYSQQAQADGEGLCCWISSPASFHVEKREAAKVFVLTLYVPDVAVFRTRPQTIDLSLPGFHRTRRFSDLSSGFHTLSIAVPKAMRKARGNVLVKITSRVQFAQGRLRYAGVLTSAYFE